MSTIPGGHEGEVETMDDGWEPDWSSTRTVTHPCGHTTLGDTEDDPSSSDPCWHCQICSGCGSKQSDCSCPVIDPFAEEEA